MELITVKDFYQNSSNKDIALYRQYLSESKREIQECLGMAIKEFGKDDEFVAYIMYSCKSIEELEAIIDNSISSLMSLEELDATIATSDIAKKCYSYKNVC